MSSPSGKPTLSIELCGTRKTYHTRFHLRFDLHRLPPEIETLLSWALREQPEQRVPMVRRHRSSEPCSSYAGMQAGVVLIGHAPAFTLVFTFIAVPPGH
jgi:hypothetical protein